LAERVITVISLLRPQIGEAAPLLIQFNPEPYLMP
jgi:hypothetical protein